MKAVIISDTHAMHHRLWLPEGDILIHCGDFSPDGPLSEHETVVRDFNRWLGRMPFKYKVVIAGNHDHLLGRKPHADVWRERLTNCIYLQDEAVEIEGIKFYGSPWTPDFFPEHWVFMQPRNSGVARQRWDQIPEDTEVLLTHGPPNGILDLCPDIHAPHRPVHVGCSDLRRRISQLPKLRFHMFGHIHPGHGIFQKDGVTFVNGSTSDRHRRPRNSPIVLDLARPVESPASPVT